MLRRDEDGSVNGGGVEAMHYSTTNGAMTVTQKLPKRHPETGIEIIIVGSGPAGLVSALECWRKGHTVTHVLERADGPMLTGDILIVQPSAMQVWRHWPQILEWLADVQYEAGMAYMKHTGEHIYGPCPPSFNDPGEQESRLGPYTAPVQARVKFYQMLLRQVEAVGIQIEYSKAVKGYVEREAAGKGGVLYADGQVALADVVIACDGHSSPSTLLVGGQPVQPKPSGMAIYRTAFPKSVAFQDEVVRQRWGSTKPTWEFWLGPQMYMGVFIHEDVVSWGFTPRDDGTSNESWIPDAGPEEALKAMGSSINDWHPAIPALVRAAPKGSIVHSPLLWRDLRRKWTSPAGHVVQVGDSAHSFLPTSGNGATQAMEDAITIATCLQLAGARNIRTGTEIYNLLRYERVACAQKMTFVNSQLKQETDWPAIEQDPSKIRTRFPKWIYRHDPEQYAYEKYGSAFAHLVGGDAFRNTNFPPGHHFVPWSIDEIKGQLASGKRVEDLLDGDWS